MSTILPPIPPTPTAASTGAEWDLYLRAVAEHNRAAHAEAQAATAVAMDAAAAAQRELLAALGPPPPAPGKPTRAQVVRGIVEALAARPIPALSSAPTASALVATAGQIADAYISANPGATEG